MGRVITVADVGALGDGGGAVVLAPGDVISPAALDEARSQGLRVVWGAEPAVDAPVAVVAGPPGLAVSAVVAGLEDRIVAAVDEVLGEVPGASVEDAVERALRRLSEGASPVREGTVAERLAAFVTGWASRGLPPDVTHEAHRLIVNNLKASVLARRHPFVDILLKAADPRSRTAGSAHVLWHTAVLPPDQAALVNSVLMEILDFNETHVPTYVHLSSPILPAVLAAAEVSGCDGDRLLTGLALGIEVELAVATMLMPTAYVRGFLPGVISGTVGAAAGAAVAMGLDFEETRSALSIAMLAAGGLFESVGSMTASYLIGNASRSGLVAADLASRGTDSPPSAFEGEKGMAIGFSVPDADKVASVLGGLGSTWRVLEGSYKRFQAETIDQAPLQCLFEIRDRTPADAIDDVASLTFRVEPLVADIAAERYLRFGTPSTDLQATFDFRYVMAAAWITGTTGGRVYTEECFTDPAILDLRERVEVLADEAITLDGARIEVRFADGRREQADVDEFRGSPGRRLSDDELSDLFRATADGIVDRHRIEVILDAVWGLGERTTVREVLGALVG